MTSSCNQHCDPALALALVIAEVAVEAWMREQTTANATETVEKLGKGGSSNDAGCSGTGSVDSRARPPDRYHGVPTARPQSYLDLRRFRCSYLGT